MSKVTLATFQSLSSPMWIMAVILGSSRLSCPHLMATEEDLRSECRTGQHWSWGWTLVHC